jgi:hypothetical protein
MAKTTLYVMGTVENTTKDTKKVLRKEKKKESTWQRLFVSSFNLRAWIP